MWDYTEKVKDHFLNPRNVGQIEKPDGVGEVGSMACGDALRLMFKLDAQGRIADVKFQTFGCASAIASSSALTELIKGKTLAEAEKVTNQDIAAYLGGLPEQKMHCSVMGREALLAAIENYHTGKTGKVSLEGRVVCTCFGVTETDIERTIRENDLTTVEQVTNYTKAGGGCGGCRPEIAKIIARVRGEPVNAEQPPPPKKRMSNMEKLKLIEKVIENDISPSLRQDGGNLELVDVDGNRVLVALRGTCAQCLASNVTLKELVEKRLRASVSDEIIVEEVKA
jgi:NifU-like protein